MLSGPPAFFWESPSTSREQRGLGAPPTAKPPSQSEEPPSQSEDPPNQALSHPGSGTWVLIGEWDHTADPLLTEG